MGHGIFPWDLHRENHARKKNLHKFFNFCSNHSIAENKNFHWMLKTSSQSRTPNFGKSQNGGNLDGLKNATSKKAYLFVKPDYLASKTT